MRYTRSVVRSQCGLTTTSTEFRQMPSVGNGTKGGPYGNPNRRTRQSFRAADQPCSAHLLLVGRVAGSGAFREDPVLPFGPAPATLPQSADIKRISVMECPSYVGEAFHDSHLQFTTPVNSPRAKSKHGRARVSILHVSLPNRSRRRLLWFGQQLHDLVAHRIRRDERD